MSKITEPASRKKILRQKGLCFIYFSEEHLVSSCKLHYVCRKCNVKHHISICTFEPSKSNVTNPPSQDDSVEATTNNFSAIKTLFYYKPLWPQQQTHLEIYTLKHFYYLTVGVKELIFPQS